MRTKYAARIEREHGQPLRDVLIRLLYVEELTMGEIADRLEIPRGSLPHIFFGLGITRSQLSAAAAAELLKSKEPEEVAS